MKFWGLYAYDLRKILCGTCQPGAYHPIQSGPGIRKGIAMRLSGATTFLAEFSSSRGGLDSCSGLRNFWLMFRLFQVLHSWIYMNFTFGRSLNLRVLTSPYMWRHRQMGFKPLTPIPVAVRPGANFCIDECGGWIFGRRYGSIFRSKFGGIDAS